MPVVAYHGYQSFAAGEVDPDTAHEIGVKLAQELWGDRYVALVATHINTDHIHNHFLLCSTSYVDGKRFHNDHAARRKMAEVSDRLCREYGLSVPESIYGKSKHYTEKKAEYTGKPTYSSLIREDVDRAIRASTIFPHFFTAMEALGYEFKTGKYLSVRAKGAQRFRRLKTLGSDYTEEAIRRRIRENWLAVMPDYKPLRMGRTYRFRGSFKSYPRLSGLRALYFHYLYKMCILPKRSGIRTPTLLREDIVKLDAITEQNKFLHKYKIDTPEQLTAYRDLAERELAVLDTARYQLRLKFKRVIPDDVKKQTRSEISEATARMRELRKEIKLCDDISERSAIMREKLKKVAEMEREQEKQKSKRKSRPRSTDGRW